MQSGISASAELQSAFKQLVSDTSIRALLATIEREAVTTKATVQSTSSAFSSDLVNLQPYLKDNEALYIFLRLPSTGNSAAPPLAAITYVPNAAPVRQKMLFASSQKSLVRELGIEHFREDFFCNAAEDLNEAGWKKHEAHTKAENPLTEEERGLEGIKEAEATEVGGTARRGAGYGSSGLGMKSADGVVEALQNLEEGSLVQLKIDSTETITLASSPQTSVSPSDLASHISTTEPRYSFYKHSYSGSDGPQTAVIFIYTCPTSAKVKERMVYASSRRSAEQLAQGEAGLLLAKKLEATDPSDITAQTIEDEFVQKQESRGGFAKPKRPGRR